MLISIIAKVLFRTRRRGPDGKDSFGVGWIPELQQRTFPFVMAPINTRVVRRSNALLGDGYGADVEEALPLCLVSYRQIDGAGILLR